MATGVGRGKMRMAAFNDSSPKTPYRCKNLEDISYTDRVIAHFVPNFVAMATAWVGRGKMRLAAFNGPSPKNPYRRKNLADISYHKPSYSPFCPKLHCHGNQKGFGVNLNDTVKLAIPENHILEPKITSLSYTQLRL